MNQASTLPHDSEKQSRVFLRGVVCLRLKSEQRTLLREILLREIHEQRGEIDELLSRPQYQEVLAQ